MHAAALLLVANDALDLEVFHPVLHAYQTDLAAKPSVAQVPRDPDDPRWAQAGMLPFRIEQCVQALSRALAAGDDADAIHWAGLLAHYAQDNTQPQHATEDYKGASYFAGAERAPDLHALFEWEGSDGRLSKPGRRRLWDAFVEALQAPSFPDVSADPWVASLEVALASYEALPPIGEAARASTTNGVVDVDAFYAHEGATSLKARQMAWAVHWTERLWAEAPKRARRDPSRTTGDPG